MSKVTVREYAFRNCFNLKEIVTTKGDIFKLNSIHDKNGNHPPLIQQIFTDCLNCFKTEENDQLTESTGNIGNLVLADGIKAIGDSVYAESNLLTNCTFYINALPEKLSKKIIYTGFGANDSGFSKYPYQEFMDMISLFDFKSGRK